MAAEREQRAESDQGGDKVDRRDTLQPEEQTDPPQTPPEPDTTSAERQQRRDLATGEENPS